MSAIGIDFGRASTVAYLCDGEWPVCRWRAIGDGAHSRIPNAADGTGLWGSAAIAADAAGLSAGSLNLESVPWLEMPSAQVFWGGLATRITSFLGRVEPLAKNGYQVVIAPQTPSFAQTKSAIETLLQRGSIRGLEGAVCVPAHRALLCRWMAESQSRAESRMTVVAVVIGEAMVTASAYEVEFVPGSTPRVLRCGLSHSVTGTGSAWWERSVTEQIVERANASIPAARFLEARDAITAIATQLRQGGQETSLPWQGPLAENLFQPFEINRRMMRHGREVLTIALQLPQTVRGAWAALGSKPDLLLLGGSGACWSFAGEALAASAGLDEIPTWLSSNPIEDLAKGAALWPVFSKVSRAVGWMDEDEATGAPIATSDVLTESPISSTTVTRPAEETQLRKGSLLTQWTRREEPQSQDLEEEL